VHLISSTAGRFWVNGKFMASTTGIPSSNLVSVKGSTSTLLSETLLWFSTAKQQTIMFYSKMTSNGVKQCDLVDNVSLSGHNLKRYSPRGVR
jgi:hypothetical protein